MRRWWIFGWFIIFFGSGWLECGPCTVEEILDSSVVVNLERCRERYEVTTRLMGEAGFTNIERWDAIDGDMTNESFFQKLNIRRGSPGEKGCAASHLFLWKAFAESDSGKECLFVCEDDMLPHSQFDELFPRYWRMTPDDFDIVQVGGAFNPRVFQKNPEWKNRLVLKHPALCTHAYILSKNGAKKLYDLYTKRKKYYQAIDIFLVHMVRYSRVVGYCYNGTMFPERMEPSKSWIVRPLDKGICFQNNCLEKSIRWREGVCSEE